MASANAEDSLSTQSPLSADPGEKLNGDGDLDYTITMNESEDEASSVASPCSPVQKENGKPSSPVKMNGKITSDEDSQNSVSKDVKVNKDSIGEGKGEQDHSLKDQTQDNGSENMEAQESGTDKLTSQCEAVDGGEKMEEDKDDDIKHTQRLDQKAIEAENGSDTNQKDDDNCQEVSKDQEDKGDVNERKESKDGQKDEGRIKQQDTKLAEKVNLPKDDDVVEIEDSPMKRPVREALESSGGLPGAKDKSSTPFIKVSSSAVSGANLVPYLSSLPGTSLLPSSGMQLVQVAGGVPGSGLMYVPSSSGIQVTATSSSHFNPTMVGINKIQPQGLPHSNASLLFSQYTNMINNQNRFMMPQYNQGVRSGIANPPVLTNIPDKPTSSIGMIENIRWEVDNHINIKPKYAKPNPKAELGHLAKWMFDLGSDMVKEFVYHDLVRIQHSRNSEGTLSDKEKEDFVKLQQIDRELNHKIGHLKIKLTKSCKCGFKTERNSVLYNHQQHAHNERGGFFSCILCKFSTRQPNTFRFHMESIHGRTAFLENRPSFFECPLCPYETNYTNRLDQHKVRCQRQFREAFNLHPSCVTGPEVNLCLENVFYFVFTRQFMNSIISKPATPVVSSSTKIRDIPSKEVTSVSMQNRRGMVNTPTTIITSSAKQIAPKTLAQTLQTGPAAIRQQAQLNSAVSRNFPVMSSKVNTIPSQPHAPTYTSGRPQLPPQNQPPVPNQPNNGFEVCEICGGYVKDRKALRIHFYYAHRIDMPFGVFERPLAPLYCATCFARFWTAQGLQKHIEVHKNDMMGTTQTSNGVAGKCISCGHRVPNILMHMRMVHNRELRHYLAALMCIFCGSRFSNKKDVEAHMGKMHGVIVKNSSVQSGIDKPQPAARNTSNASFQQSKASTPAQKPSTNAAAPKGGASGKMNRGSQCVLCNLSFPRNVDLTRHCMRVHHTCMKCGLVVVDKESLARHTCLHSASGMRTCQICKESGFHPAYYIKHMRDKHLRKCCVVLRHIDRAVVETMKRPITISDSEDEEEPESKFSEPKRPKRETNAKVEKVSTEESAADSDTKPEGMDQVSPEEKNTCEAETNGKNKQEDMDKSEKECADFEEKHKSDEEEKPEKGEKNIDSELCEGDQGASSKEDEPSVKSDPTLESDSDDKPVNDDIANDYKNSEDTKGQEDDHERSGDAVTSESKPRAIQEKCLEVSSTVDDHNEKQDEEGNPQKENSDELEKDSSDKLDNESLNRKPLKRKVDETESEVEKDRPSRKSQRRASQVTESQE